MIGLLRGRIVSRQPPFLLLDVNGVGYEVEAPMSTFYDLPPGDGPVTLYTHLMVRDDAHTLFGFVRERDRTLFRMLLKVSGVGGKMALAILSGMTADEFSLSVQAGDVAALTRLPGVGKKTADRIILELKGLLPAAPGEAAAPVSEDAISALVNLGYSRKEAEKAVMGALADGVEDDLAALLRHALHALNPAP